MPAFSGGGFRWECLIFPSSPVRQLPQPQRLSMPRTGYTPSVQAPPTRFMKILGWVNLLLGVSSPLRMGFHIASALSVFSYAWCADSILLLVVIGTIIGALTGVSGWELLKGYPRQRQVSCIAGGLTLGHAGVGIFIMFAFGTRRSLDILIRHGSTNWLDWSLSHFQSPAFLEIPLVVWWMFCLSAILSRREPGKANGILGQSLAGIGLILVCAVLGGLSRWLQFGIDVEKYSQR